MRLSSPSFKKKFLIFTWEFDVQKYEGPHPKSWQVFISLDFHMEFFILLYWAMIPFHYITS